MGNIVGKAKKAVQGFVKFVKKIINMVKFFMTYVGWVVAILILVVFLIIALAVLIRTAEHALGKWLDADYAGISTEGDYEYLVSSLGYAGYDSLITEKVWQEFMAYEYAVLMDVAEFIYDGQEEYYGDPNNMKGAYGPYSEAYYNDEDEAQVDPNTGKKIAGPAYMPYLEVKGEYDISKMSFKDWQKCVIEGQGSARFGITSIGQLTDSPGIENGKISYGGNRDVMPPTLLYEFKTNPYEPEAKGSLVPYITVLKEQLKYYYYTVGGREDFRGSKNDKNGGVVINESNIDLVNLMEINNTLNAANPYLPKSTALSEHLIQNPELNPLSNEDAWPVADTKLPQDLYFTNDYGSVTYKTALQIIIDRYLPKASLLTAWYYVKDTDLADPETQGRESADSTHIQYKFNIDELMIDIKSIYNYYCWTNAGESYTDESIQAILYDSGDGTVVRLEGQGSPAETYPSTQTIATTNNDTFIHFGQAGLETNRFGVFNLYEVDGSTTKPSAPQAITGDSEEVTIPVATEVLSEKAEFLDRFGLDASYDYTYRYTYTQRTWVPPVYGSAEGGTGTEVTIRIDNALHHHNFGSSTFRISARTCETCYRNYEEYNGWKIVSITPGRNHDTYRLQDGESASGGGGTSGGKVLISPGYWHNETVEAIADATAFLVVPYEATRDLVPRGYEDIPESDKISKYIHAKVVMQGGYNLVDDNEELKAAEVYTIESQESELMNNGYRYPERTGPSKDDPTKVAAEPLTYYDEYWHEIPFFNFHAFSGDSMTPERVKELFNVEMSELSQTLSGSSGDGDKEFFKLFLEIVPTMPEPDPTDSMPETQTRRDFEFQEILSVNRVTINGFATPDQDARYNYPSYTVVADQPDPYNAIIDIDEYVLGLILDISQKRVATMIVTDVEAWAKSATYSIEIIQNSFDYTNYRYVVPHSYFSFGVRVFKIDENPSYRIEYYKAYFSKYEEREPGIKEADVLTMMMKWEEFAKSGNDTAYAFMRDLYKLIMYIREAGDQILGTAYTYMYVPDTIWEFREGISQEAFWTERLAAELYGDDALTEEELRKVRVKKEEIAWQILDYDEYAECQYEENGELKAKVYALFPFGAPYTRTWFMEDALEKGVFYDGNYTDGHGGADWTSRAKMSSMLAGEAGLAKEIYDYELRSRTLRNIMNGTGNYNEKIEKALDFIRNGSGGTAYTKAENELRVELREYEVNSPEVAVAGGVVYKADYNCYSGFSAGVTHTNDDAETSATTSYVHMRRWPVVQAGDIVGPGTVLGYEGTTGNSGGNHLHQNINIGGEKDSPAEYMGPIFAPFYNQEKVFEISQELANYSPDQRLLLGTDYYTLIRTVLMQEFDSSGKAKYSGDVMPEGQATYLKTASFVTISGDEYIDFYGADTKFDELGNPIGGASAVLSGDKVIVKVGINPVEYYLCKYKAEVINSNSSSDASLSGDDYLSSKGTTLLKVLSKEKIDDFSEEVLSNSIRVETDVDIESITTVVWGNNVPYSPIIADMDDAIDITSLDVEKAFKATDFANEYASPSNDPPDDLNDVKATKDFFDAEKAKDKINVPDWMLLYLSDIDSPYSIPFYEGPVSVAHQNSGIMLGLPGSISGDLEKFQQAIRMKGLDPNRELVMSGEFDVITERILRENVAPVMDEPGAIANGAAGTYGGYSIDGVVRWNAYVTYGSCAAARKAGLKATEIGATLNGQHPLFIAAVAQQESGFLPTNESNEFCAGADSISWVDSPAFPDETTDLDVSAGTIVYRGVKRTIRRAQGLMQLAPGVGLSRARQKVGNNIDQIVSLIRSPRGNATLGAEYLSQNKQDIMANTTNYERLKEIVKANPAFEQMAKDSGISGMELALSGCSAYMYNKGPNGGNTENIIEQMANLKYDPSTKTAYYNEGDRSGKTQEHGYSHRVITYMVQNATEQTRTY